MTINYIAVLAATVAQFIFGAIWYMPIFGKLWGKIHGFDQVSPEKQKEMMADMWKPLVIQFISTFVTTWVLASLSGYLTGGMTISFLALLLWVGFIVPTQIAAVLFGGTNPKWVTTKIAIMAGAGLGCMLIAAFVLSQF